MSYVTCLELVDIKIKSDCLDTVRRQLRKHKTLKDATLKYFLDWVAIDMEGFLCFRNDPNFPDGYAPD